jgi:hypothetical protein
LHIFLINQIKNLWHTDDNKYKRTEREYILPPYTDKWPFGRGEYIRRQMRWDGTRGENSELTREQQPRSPSALWLAGRMQTLTLTLKQKHARTVAGTKARFRFQNSPQISLCKKKISHHIKMSAHIWSTKCRWNQKLITQFYCTLRDEYFKPN